MGHGLLSAIPCNAQARTYTGNWSASGAEAKAKGQTMLTDQIPRHYQAERQEHAEVYEALEQLGRAVRNAGPIETKHGHLMQLAASIAIGSEGASHSHVRRALEAGATPSEVIHSILLLTCTLGYPTVSKGLSWAEDIIKSQPGPKQFDA